ncbi:MAG: hypothetical protein ACSW8K_06130 [bacterium]
MNKNIKNIVWIVSAITAIVFAIAAMYFYQAAPVPMVLDDGTTVYVHPNKVKTMVCFSISALCILGGLAVS